MVRIVCLVSILYASTVCALDVYHIGNSHTRDAMPHGGLRSLAADAGFTLDNGWHVRWAKSLDYIYKNPEEYTPITIPDSNPYGTWPDALSNNKWDAITFQSYLKSTGAEELEAITSMLEHLDQQQPVRIMLYIDWPPSDSDYSSQWEAGYGSSDQDMNLSYRYYVWLYSQLRKAGYERASVEYIPIGGVLYEIDQRIKAGVLSELASINDCYKDAAHLNNVGRYVAGLTLISVLYDFDVRELNAPPTEYNSNYGNYVPLTSSLADQLKSIVWDVVSADRFSMDELEINPKIAVEEDSVLFSFDTYLGYDYIIGRSNDLVQWQSIDWFQPGNGSRTTISRSVGTSEFYTVQFR